MSVTHRPIQHWVRWYEVDGIEEVTRHKRGNRKTPHQAWAIKQTVSEGRFRTRGEAVRGCRKCLMVFAVGVSEEGMPCPLAERADVQSQEAWKKGAFGGPSAAGGGFVCG